MRETLDRIHKPEFDHLCIQTTKFMSRAAMQCLTVHGFYGLDPREDAPSTYEELQAFMATGQRGLFPVFNGGNDAAIYEPKFNMLFRAWHDLLHVELNAPFTYEGELKVAIKHQAVLVAHRAPQLVRELVCADTAGQVMYHEASGSGFVQDQRAFGLDCLNYGLLAAVEIALEAAHQPYGLLTAKAA